MEKRLRYFSIFQEVRSDGGESGVFSPLFMRLRSVRAEGVCHVFRGKTRREMITNKNKN
jgi:hypothetical protein